MLPIVALSPAAARALEGVLFDLDDTLLDHGQLGEAAYSALFRLRESGLRLVAVTGRPAGWADVLLRQWPLDAAVAENGAVLFHRTPAGIVRLDAVSPEEREQRRSKLDGIVALVSKSFPELHPADDVAARHSDFTFDIGEHRRVAASVVAAAARLGRQHGAATQQSSVHLHLSLDRDDKASGVVRLLCRVFGADPSACRHRYAYLGDSENDAACFAFFRTSIGVANLAGRPTLRPRFVTTAPRGRGFAEAASVIVARRG